MEPCPPILLMGARANFLEEVALEAKTSEPRVTHLSENALQCRSGSFGNV